MAKLDWLRLPAEMRQRKQWAVATLSPIPGEADKVDKIPRHPVSRLKADSTDPNTWGTFEEAVNSGCAGIGFMLTADDPFVVIDLDDKGDLTEEQRARHRKIYEAFDSYAELSQSGKGVHIILRGHVGGGLNRDRVEIYDQERFIICTGNIIRNQEVRDHRELIDRLVHEMGGVTQTGTQDLPESSPERMSDDEVIAKAETARNGEKFKDLFYRKPAPGEDWSHRDASLAQIIAFYTRNHDQALRIFRRSALYRPHDKGKNPQHYESYYLLGKTFARAWRAEIVRDADLDHGKRLVTGLLAPRSSAAPEAPPVRSVSPVPEFPEGLVGKVAHYILRSAQRPVHEIALAGGLAFVAGLCARQYNVSNTGLNLYIVLLAETGRGKEAAASGIETLVNTLRTKVPSIETFMGPGGYASGQALVRALDSNPCLFSTLGEFGHMLRTITDKRASASDVKLRQVLLNLFSKSGKNQKLRATAYSDTDKNTQDVEAPAFTFLGDTTPEAYYASFSSGLIGEGLLPRFLTITYDGPRVPTNEAPRIDVPPDLGDHLASLVTSVLNLQQTNNFVDVGLTPEAGTLDKEFDQYCDARINEPGANAMAEVWNRAHLKMRRVAAVLAVGRNHMAPQIGLNDVDWAIRLIKADIENMAAKVESGDVGDGESRRAPAVELAIRDFIKMPTSKKASTYKVPQAIVNEPIIPYGYFRRRFKHHQSFQSDPRGMVQAIKSAVADAVELGLLQKLSQEQIILKVGPRADGDYYAIGPNFE